MDLLFFSSLLHVVRDLAGTVLPRRCSVGLPLMPKEDGSTSWAPLEGPLWGQATGLLPSRVCQGLRPANTVALALAGYVLADG